MYISLYHCCPCHRQEKQRCSPVLGPYKLQQFPDFSQKKKKKKRKKQFFVRSGKSISPKWFFFFFLRGFLWLGNRKKILGMFYGAVGKAVLSAGCRGASKGSSVSPVAGHRGWMSWAGGCPMGRGICGSVLLLVTSLSQSQKGLHGFWAMLVLWTLPCCTLGICVSQKVKYFVITQKPVPWLWSDLSNPPPHSLPPVTPEALIVVS